MCAQRKLVYNYVPSPDKLLQCSLDFQLVVDVNVKAEASDAEGAIGATAT